MKGYQMSLDDAMEFYRRCSEMGLKSEESRIALMNEMIHERNIKILDEKGFKKAVEGKKILKVETKDEPAGQ